MDITEDDYNFLPVWLAPAQRVRPARVDMHPLRQLRPLRGCPVLRVLLVTRPAR